MRKQIERLINEEINLKNDVYVKDILNYLEIEFRMLCLVLLNEITSSNIVLKSMYAEIAGLQRPSWGCWNGFLQGVMKERRNILNAGSLEQRDIVNNSKELTWIAVNMEQIEEIKDKEFRENCEQILGKSFGKNKRTSLKVLELLTMPIQIRNRVAHDNPQDNNWWGRVRYVLTVIVKWYLESGFEKHFAEASKGEPWLLKYDGEIWCYNGIDSKGEKSSVFYVSLSGKSRVDSERIGRVMSAFKKILGAEELQEANFEKLINSITPEELKGFFLDDYIVGEKTGEGGFAEVFKGIQLSTGRKVALKILKPGLTETDRYRFLQEAEYMSRFDHANIARIYEQSEEPWRKSKLYDLSKLEWFINFKKNHGDILTYIAMEWIEGKTLDEIYTKMKDRREDYEEKAIAKWFMEAAEALEIIHNANLIHRDISPKNIMITENGIVKLMDFGISRTQYEKRTIMTSYGEMLGSEPYMSPEQLSYERAKTELGPRSDIYSLGSTFYELFTKTRLYNHNNEIISIATASDMKKNGERPELPNIINRNISWEISTILMGCLENQPADRYQNAQKLKVDIKHYLVDEPIEYKKPTLSRRIQLMYKRKRFIINLSAIFIVIIGIVTALYVGSVILERNKAVVADKKSKQSLAKMYYKEADQEISKNNEPFALAYLSESFRTDGQPYTLAKIASLLQNERWPIMKKELPQGIASYYINYIIHKEGDKNIEMINLQGDTVAEMKNSEKAKSIGTSFSGNCTAAVITSDSNGSHIKLWDEKGKEMPSPEVEGSKYKFSGDGKWICIAGNTKEYCLYSYEKKEYRNFKPIIGESTNYNEILPNMVESDMVVYDDAQRVAYIYGGTIGFYKYNGDSYDQVMKKDLSEFFQYRKDAFADIRTLLKTLPDEGLKSPYLMNNHLWISNDMGKIAVSNAASFIVLDSQTGKLLLSDISLKHFVTDIGFSSDSSQVAVARGTTSQTGMASAGGYLSLFDLKAKKEIFHTEDRFDTPYASVQFSPDQKLLLGRDMDRTVHILEAETGKVYAQPISTASPMTSAKFADDGSHIITEELGLVTSQVASSFQARTQVWSIKNSVNIELASMDPSIFQLKSSEDGKNILLGLNRAIYCLDSKSGKTVYKKNMPMKDYPIMTSMDINYRNKNIFTGYSTLINSEKQKGYIQVMSEDGKDLSEMVSMDDYSPDIGKFSPDGKKLLVLWSNFNLKGFMQIWDCSWTKLKLFLDKKYGAVENNEKFESALWTPDGKNIIAVDDGNIYIFDVKGALISKSKVVDFAEFTIKDICLSKDGRYLAVSIARKLAGNLEVKDQISVFSVKNLETGNGKASFNKELDTSPQILRLSPNENCIAVACTNGDVNVMKFPDVSVTTTVLKHQGKITDIKFDNTSQFIAVALDQSGPLNVPEYKIDNDINRNIQVLTKSKGKYLVWSIMEQQPISTSEDLKEKVVAITLTADNSFIFATADKLYTQWIPRNLNETWISNFSEMISGYKLSNDTVLRRVYVNGKEIEKLIPSPNSEWYNLSSQSIKESRTIDSEKGAYN